MSILIYKGYWTRNYVKKTQNCLFIFGDNDCKMGKGGQAIIRGLKNVKGIPTKKFPNNYYKSFYTDKEYDDNCAKIDIAINKIKKTFYSKKYDYLVLPEDGFGTGLSRLPSKAPLTYEYLKTAVAMLIEELN
jgi:hypothetical protein